MKTSVDTTKVTLISLLSNGILAILKASAGILGNSQALMADAIESTADVCSSFMVLLGIRYTKKPADENHPYGHGKLEPLITFGVVIFLIVSAIFIAVESVGNIQQPNNSIPEPWTLIVLVLIIAWKELSFRYMIEKGKKTNSLVLKAEAWHHRMDAITSILALIGISVAVLLGEEYAAADDWAALLASAIILYNSYKLFRPALAEVMDEHVYDELVEEIRVHSKEVEGVVDTEKCYVRKVGSRFFIDLHLIVNGSISVREGHDIAHALKDYLCNRNSLIAEVLIHVEPTHEKQD